MKSGAKQEGTAAKEKGKTWRLLNAAFALTGNLSLYLLVAVTAAVITAVIHVVQASLFALLWDSMLAADLPEFNKAATATLALEAVAVLLITVQKVSIGRYGHSSVALLNSKAAYRISRARASYMSGEHSGQILARVTNDLNLVQTLLQDNLLRLISGLLTAILAVCYMVYKDWLLAIVAVFGTPLIFFAAGKLQGPLAALTKEAQEALSEISVLMEESIAGAAIARVFGLGKNLSERFRLYSKIWLEKSTRRNTFAALLASVGLIVSFTPFLLVFGLGGILMLQGRVTFGVLFAFIDLLNFVTFPMEGLPRNLGEIASNSAALERVLEVLRIPVERECGKPFEFIEGVPVVEFQNVTFAYPDAKEPALKNVSFTVEQGEKVAFAGSSGSGKSTIFRLLLGEYEPDQGTVLVGGHDVSKWSLRHLRSHFAKVSQDTYLFPYSIRENLTMGMPDVTMEEVNRAANTACISGFISELPDAYETQAGEMAGRFSGGERQRLSLARAILREPEILLLDEATSAMDYDVERQVLDSLMEMFEGRTVMAIAHRLSTIVNMDRIYVLEGGTLVESGTHASLMEAKGRYATLYSSQQSGQDHSASPASSGDSHRSAEETGLEQDNNLQDNNLSEEV
ncbi:MAG: ABC transporter ATP-binding protein [Bacillota bacterium]|jgi:ABC-type multidrug transport system fused ATPase/permease subunit